MDRGARALCARLIGWWATTILVVGALVLLAPAVTPAAAAETTWLCKPGLASNPCESSEETTVQLGNGSTSIEHAQPASNPPIDCFYVYPTVSSQTTANANLEIDPEETQIAIDQASRFSQTCKVYAPMYPQLTLKAISTPGEVTPATEEKAYLGVLSAWQEYLAKYNNGRGVVLIGHSQGSLLLEQLIKEQVDPSAALRKQLVSALLMGGNVLVPKGQTVGGTFKNVPACQTSGQTGCVVAYSSFLEEPPEGSYFGYVNSPLLATALTEEEASKLEVLCVNPGTLITGNAVAPLQRFESTSPFPGLLANDYPVPKASTPWVSMPGQYSGQCERADGATWLQLVNTGPAGDPRLVIKEPLGPLWGTHLEDINVAFGNLVQLTAIESKVFAGGLQVTSIAPSSGLASGGTAVTIKGSGFLAGATVQIGSAATSVNVSSETEITATTAATSPGSYEVAVTDSNGTSANGPSYTYYSSPPPTVVTGAASSVSTGAATIGATVNPNGGAVSQCRFEYGATPSYGSSAPCTPSPGSGTSAVAVSASLTGLSQNTSYHFRIVATNPGGTSAGADQAFRTPQAVHWYVNGTGPFARAGEGETIPTISWGTLTLTNLLTGSKITCHTVAAGYVENPGSGAAGPSGVGATQAFAPYACEDPACATAGSGVGNVAGLRAEGLPWKSQLSAAGTTVRNVSEAVKLDVICDVSLGEGSFSQTAEPSEGQSAPLTLLGGPSVLSPSRIEFDAGAGTLHGLTPGPEETRHVSFEGTLKTLGYSSQEIINAKVN